MSDNWLQFVPDDPNFQPSANAAKVAEEMLASFVPDADNVCAKFFQSITFFDPVAFAVNFAKCGFICDLGICCP